MKVKNSFLGGRMNKDVDFRILPKNQYIHAENVRIIAPDGSNAGAAKIPFGNTQITNFDFGTNATWHGHDVDTFSNKLRWAVRSDRGNYVVEYDSDTQTSEVILQDERPPALNVLNFQEGFEATDMRILNDSDNGKSFLFITDDLNEIRYFNTERAKTFTQSAFEETDISLLKNPPLSAPTLVLDNDVSVQDNNIERKFISFAYRYRYLDDEYSAFSPFSEFAFEAKRFQFDYATSTNNSMFNNANVIDITLNTGDKRVIGIDLLFKESGSNSVYVVEKFSKDDQGWNDDEFQTVRFSNSKIYQVLESRQLNRIFDNVPRRAKGLEIINNRPIFGNYTENYDIVDASGNIITPSLSLSYVSETTMIGASYPTAKSNRDYEIAIAYLDGKGRITTPFTSDGNTTYVKNIDSDKRNSLQVQVNHKAPEFATNYRFYIKQSKISYDTLAPVVFFQDGVYVWVKLEGNDFNKVAEGDFLYVKSDSSKILDDIVQTKVLEVKDQPANFLEEDDVLEIMQPAGTYMRVRPDGYTLRSENLQVYEYAGSGFRSRNTQNNFGGNVSYLEEPVYYGAIGLNDLSAGGSYSGTEDIRYDIEIVSNAGAVDTFRWRAGAGGVLMDNGGAGFPITGGAQTLENGVSITFGSTTGHDPTDRWIVSAKSDDVINETVGFNGVQVGSFGRRALVHYKGKPKANESIIGGAVITI